MITCEYKDAKQTDEDRTNRGPAPVSPPEASETSANHQSTEIRAIPPNLNRRLRTDRMRARLQSVRGEQRRKGEPSNRERKTAELRPPGAGYWAGTARGYHLAPSYSEFENQTSWWRCL